MTTVFGGGINYEVDFKEITNEIDAKIKLTQIENEKKFVNETGDKITSLKITEEPKNELDAVNLKYVKNLFEKIYKEKFNELDNEYKKKFDLQENKIKQVQQTITQENEIFKNGVEVLVKQIKSQIEKIKGDVSRHTVNELRLQKENTESHMKQFKTEFESHMKQFKTEFESHMKQFNLLNKNITKWHGEVEDRFKKIVPPEKLQLNSDEVTLKKIKEKIRKIKEKEPKKKFHVLFEKEHYVEKYGLSEKEYEIYKKWLDSKKTLL